MISCLRAINVKTKPKKKNFLFKVKFRNIRKLWFKKYIQFFIQLYIMEVPQHCPGTESATAGKVAACQGCPNQTICSSGVSKQPNIGAELVRARLSSVKNIILVLSGKGGVGKSTFTSLLARCIAGGNEDVDVAILDIDICGPSMPRVMGVLGEQVHGSGSGWSPVFVEDNLCVMSIGFMLPNQDDAIIWRGPRKNGMIRQFLSDVDWGDSLDYLIIDTPPGTSDEHLAVTQFLKNIENVSAVVLTTPQEISLLDVRKEIDFLKKVNVSIIGVIENMSSFVCPKCKCNTQIFPRDTGGAVKMCKELDVPYLGSIPLDPLVARCCDEGLNPFEKYPNSLAVTAVKTIVPKIIDHDKLNVTEENK